VTDDGRGLAGTADRGNGLAIMRERAEELGGNVVASSPGSGVRVQARLPIGVAALQPHDQRAPV
jgi:signal transduction histidine kinase